MYSAVLFIAVAWRRQRIRELVYKDQSSRHYCGALSLLTLLGILRLGDDLNCQYRIVFALSFAIANGYLTPQPIT